MFDNEIKILPCFFEQVICGNKKFELRFNDRRYKVGDIYTLREYCNGKYTGRICKILITYVLDNFNGLQKGWCVFSFDVLPLGGQK